MKSPTKFLNMDIETDGLAEDDKILGITVASTVLSTIDGVIEDRRVWWSADAAGKPLPKLTKEKATELLLYIKAKQDEGYAICAWNGASFDFKMLGYAADNLELAGKIVMGMFDLMLQFLTQKGFAVGLAAVAKGLGIEQKKSMDGKDAPQAWKDGRFEEVIKYVIGDSEMGDLNVRGIIKAGGVSWTSKGGKPCWCGFTAIKTVAECLAEAMPNQSWMDKPLDRNQMVRWIPDAIRNAKQPRKEREDAGRGEKPILLVISGPSGSGKTLLCEELIRTMPSIEKAVTTTTRPPRKSERDGVDYNFVTPDKFDKMVAAGEFLEWAEVHGNKYGSSKSDVSTKLAKGQDIVMIVDVQGAKSIRNFMDVLPVDSRSRFLFADVFVMPPSIEELKKRLMSRGQDDEKTIETRMVNAAAEIAKAPTYKYIVMNDEMDKAWERLKSILIAERCLSAGKK